MLVLLLSGCSVLETQPDRTAEQKMPQQEVKRLLAQPYIDPLTDYLKQHRRDAQRRSVLKSVAVERDRRCEQVAQRYAQRAKTDTVLSRYRKGYEYSCPEQVKAFAELVVKAQNSRQPEPASDLEHRTAAVAAIELATRDDKAAANECYLLAQIHNHADAISACSVPARSGDLKAQRALADSLTALQRFDEARGWLLKAAQQHDIQAQIRLAEMSLNAQTGAADPAQAWAWYRQAGDAAQAASLEAGLTPQQRQQALQRVRKQLDAGH
ncbi:hypothetical protein GCM10009104_32900 [Marinobacterium maritimum]|uniref:Sel1 repeat family protein n=1 Tax=Marinobacterium maritimum TaxID=500162 RepID=A0ABP3TGP6_9GAMM